MKGKRLLTLVSAIILVLALVALPLLAACAEPAPAPAPAPAPKPTPAPAPKPPPKPEKVVLKMVQPWPMNTIEGVTSTMWVEAVNKAAAEKYPGEFEIDYLGGGEVIPMPAQNEAVRTGVVHITATTTAYYPGEVPAIDAMKFSVLTGYEERDSGLIEFLQPIHRKQMNVVYLGANGLDVKFTAYPKVDVLHRSGYKPYDFTGLKLRTSPVHRDPMLGVGATPVVMGPPDIYTGLERGTIDGFCWPTVGTFEWKWYEVCKYMVQPGFLKVRNVFLVNADAWDKLPKHLQDLLTEVTARHERDIVGWFKAREAEDNRLLQENGVAILHLSEKDAKIYLNKIHDFTWNVCVKNDPVNCPKILKIINPELYKRYYPGG